MQQRKQSIKNHTLASVSRFLGRMEFAIQAYENGKFVLQENSNVRYSFAEDGSVIDIDINKALAEMKK